MILRFFCLRGPGGAQLFRDKVLGARREERDTRPLTFNLYVCLLVCWPFVVHLSALIERYALKILPTRLPRMPRLTNKETLTPTRP